MALRENPDTYQLRIELYCDEFSTSDSASAAKRRTKIFVVYFTINNLPYYLQSKRDAIFLCLVTTRHELKKLTIEKFFKPLIDDIKRLQIPTDFGLDKDVTAYLSAIIADNLESNELANLTRGFNSDSCKSCKILHKDFQLKSYYENAANFTLLDNVLRRDYRNSNHIFKDIMRTENIFTFDAFHDLNEGTIPKLMNALIKIHYKTKENFDSLNQAIRKTSFYHGKVAKIDKNNPTVRGTGMQVRY